MNRRHAVLARVVGVVAVACLLSVGVYLVPPFVSRENAAVEWALRLPQELRRAQAAGFTGTKRVVPKIDPRTDAGADWVRLDAQMRANAPDGLRGKLERDSFQAVNLYGVMGASLRARSLPSDVRPYAVGQSLMQWDKHLTRQTKDAPDWLQNWNLSGLLRTRLIRDTDRALTQAVYSHVTGSDAPLPEDPFAPKAGTPLHKRNLPGGVVMWHSVGANGKDDDGDFQRDRTFRLMPTK